MLTCIDHSTLGTLPEEPIPTDIGGELMQRFRNWKG
jgi:hypothetical protein